MGLLDALFSSDGYGGQGGGLLDLIRNTQAQNSQYQPGQGLPPMQPPATFADRFGAMPGAAPQFAPSGRQFDSAQFDPSTFAPNQAQPISVGDYQMPRMGSADQFTPPPQMAALPQNAQPTQGQLPSSTDISAQSRQPQQQTLPTFMGGQQGGGLGDRLSAGLQNFANAGGPLQALAGGISGLASGNRTDALGIQQQNQAAQFQSLYQSLRENGETEQAAKSKAMLAVMNPEAAKTVLPELLSNRAEWGVISDDPLEGKKYGWINKNQQTINGKEMGAQGAASTSQGGLAGIQAAQASGIKGDALYEYLPKAMAPTVKAMIEGRQPLPSTTAMRSPATLALIDAAHSIDPTFDATAWATRVKGQADYYGGGKSSEIMRKANQSALHFGELVSDKMADLPGHDIPAANVVANFVNTNLLGKGAQGNFEVNAHALADELAGLFKGANLSDTEIRAWESRLSPNMSLEQQRGMAKTLLGLYRDSVTALEKKRVESIGQAAADRKGPILGPEADAALSGVEKFANGGTRAAPGGVDRSAIEAEMRKRGLLK